MSNTIVYNYNNDSLFICLNKMVFGLPWKTPVEFKKKLGIQFCEEVSIDYMKHIESKLPTSYTLNVIGIKEYKSVRKPTKQNILLKYKKDGKYAIVGEKKLMRARGISQTEKKLLIHKKDEDNRICFDGMSEFIMNKNEFQQHYKNPKTSKYVLVNNNMIDENWSLNDTYNKFKEIADGLKNATNGEINMYKTGNYNKTALDLFYRTTKGIIADKIENEEAKWLYNATRGAIIFGEAYKGPCSKFDFVSMYPSIMIDKKFKVPIKAGEFKTFTNEYFQTFKDIGTGIYRVKIQNKPGLHKLFRINYLDYYTYIDLNRAKELKLIMNIIEDGSPNALLYNATKCISAELLFKKFVDILYPLKEKKILGAKMCLLNLWGALTQRKIIKKDFNEGEEIFFENEIISIRPIGTKGKTRLTGIPKDSLYQTAYGRLGCFLLASGRVKLSKIIEPIQNDVVRSHTDSLYVKNKVKLDCGSSIGDLLYEGYCENFSIKNATKYDKNANWLKE